MARINRYNATVRYNLNGLREEIRDQFRQAKVKDDIIRRTYNETELTYQVDGPAATMILNGYYLDYLSNVTGISLREVNLLRAALYYIGSDLEGFELFYRDVIAVYLKDERNLGLPTPVDYPNPVTEPEVFKQSGEDALTEFVKRFPKPLDEDIDDPLGTDGLAKQAVLEDLATPMTEVAAKIEACNEVVKEVVEVEEPVTPDTTIVSDS